MPSPLEKWMTFIDILRELQFSVYISGQGKLSNTLNLTIKVRSAVEPCVHWTIVVREFDFQILNCQVKHKGWTTQMKALNEWWLMFTLLIKKGEGNILFSYIFWRFVWGEKYDGQRVKYGKIWCSYSTPVLYWLLTDCKSPDRKQRPW